MTQVDPEHEKEMEKETDDKKTEEEQKETDGLFGDTEAGPDIVEE